MKALKRVLFINWYTITKQIIEFSELNFLTGDTGAGKSTIIDGLQLLFLGDLSGQYFNKSASENSDRTVLSYLRGELSGNDKNNFIYFRNYEEYPTFSSYITAEFYDDRKNSYFTVGVVFDCFPDGDYDHRFFIINNCIPDNEFIENDVPLRIDDLKPFFKTNYKPSDLKVFTKTQYEYHSELLSVFGSVNRNFFNIFKKAVPFTPNINIEKFISEYVCDINTNINIKEMKENFRHYKQIEIEIEQVKSKIAELKDIQEEYSKYGILLNNLDVCNYVVDKANEQIKSDLVDKSINQVEKNKEFIQRKEVDLAEVVTRLEELEKLIDEKKEALRETGFDEINNRIKDLKNKIEETLGTIKQIETKLKSYGYNWKGNIEAARELCNLIRQPSAQVVLHTTLLDDLNSYAEYLYLINSDTISSITNEYLTQIKLKMDEYKNSINNMLHSEKNKFERIDPEIKRLEHEIKQLQKGNRPLDDKYLEFKRELELALSNKYGKKIEVSMLCELIDIKDESWRNAIEAYLNTQRFDFIIDPQYYPFASRFYYDSGYDKKYFDIGLVDIENLIKSNPKTEHNSLAEEIESTSHYSKVYADFLLGRVIKCLNIQDIRKYRVSITKNCTLYQNFVQRMLHENRWKTPYVGRNSIVSQLEIKKAQVQELKDEFESLTQIISELKRLSGIETLNELAISYILSVHPNLSNLGIFQSELMKARKKLESMDLLYTTKIKEQIGILKGEETKREEAKIELIKEIERLATQSQTLNMETIPLLIRGHEEAKSVLKKYNDIAWVGEYGDPEYIKSVREFRGPYKLVEKYTIDADELGKHSKEKKVALERKMGKYNEKYHMTFGISPENINEYTHELNRLIDTELPEHEEEIKETKMRAYEQFRDEFIGKLQSNIYSARLQIEELNKALQDVPFGKGHKYKFDVKANPDYKPYYDMIIDPMFYTGFYSSSPEVIQKHGDALDSLFKQITDSADDTMDEELRKNIEKKLKLYADYRTYLKFDLFVIKGNGKPESLANRLTKKSGGETQTPFYICILASFVRTYMMNQNDKYSNTIRMIIFDEAFSKMDDKHVPECVKLLKKFGFQAILSAPSSKIGEITPIVDKTILVMSSDDQIYTKEFDNKDIKDLLEA